MLKMMNVVKKVTKEQKKSATYMPHS